MKTIQNLLLLLLPTSSLQCLCGLSLPSFSSCSCRGNFGGAGYAPSSSYGAYPSYGGTPFYSSYPSYPSSYSSPYAVRPNILPPLPYPPMSSYVPHAPKPDYVAPSPNIISYSTPELVHPVIANSIETVNPSVTTFEGTATALPQPQAEVTSNEIGNSDPYLNTQNTDTLASDTPRTTVVPGQPIRIKLGKGRPDNDDPDSVDIGDGTKNDKFDYYYVYYDEKGKPVGKAKAKPGPTTLAPFVPSATFTTQPPIQLENKNEAPNGDDYEEVLSSVKLTSRL